MTAVEFKVTAMELKVMDLECGDRSPNYGSSVALAVVDIAGAIERTYATRP